MNKVRRERLKSQQKAFLRKPPWLRVRAPVSEGYLETRSLVRESSLHTICEEAACPNIGECWQRGHAAVMILGDICTRSCRFCNVKSGKPEALDSSEPENIALMARKMRLSYLVITSVDRDDLDDGGAEQFAACIREVRAQSPSITIEVLTPDFRGKVGALEKVVKARPDVFNHNIETVPRLYREISPSARYFHSLQLLSRVRDLDAGIFTKSGMMVGLGEEKGEVLQVMDDLRSARVDFLTIGQYLQPTSYHWPVMDFVTPEQFKDYEKSAESKGFLMVSASPLTRSSYHADDDFALLRKARERQLRQEETHADL